MQNPSPSRKVLEAEVVRSSTESFTGQREIMPCLGGNKMGRLHTGTEEKLQEMKVQGLLICAFMNWFKIY